MVTKTLEKAKIITQAQIWQGLDEKTVQVGCEVKSYKPLELINTLFEKKNTPISLK